MEPSAQERALGGSKKAANVGTLRREFESGRLPVLGGLLLPYVGLNPNDPRLEPYFALAEELDIPVALHTGAGPPRVPYEGAPLSRVGLGNPLLLEEVLVRHPKLRFYFMHAGEPWFDDVVCPLPDEAA